MRPDRLRPARPAGWLCAALFLLPLCPAGAQQGGAPQPGSGPGGNQPGSVRPGGEGPKSDDPRDVPDPRDAKDPRRANDPRDRDAEPDPFGKLEGRELYEALLAKGETGRLKVEFKADQWELLPYIDSHCEGWLALVENGAAATPEGQQKLDAMQAKGRQLAEWADQVLQDSRFTQYVTNFYGWTPEQQKEFREGQKLFGEGARKAQAARSPEEMMLALTPLQQSLDRARRLGDTWGQSMALTVMANVQSQTGHDQEAFVAAGEAARIGREIRDLSSVWTGLEVTYTRSMATNDFERARDALRQQYLVAVDQGDEESQEGITKQLLLVDKLIDER